MASSSSSIQAPRPSDCSTPLITARGVHVALERVPILHDLTFEVGRGRWVGLLGPNGSGKTTLLRTISGLLPYRGALQLEGREVVAWPAGALARRLAFVRQSVALSFDFTVEDLVLLGRAPHKRWLDGYTAADRRAMREALARVELEGFAERSARSLSGGEQQRVFLAQALVQEADLLLLDEPTAHLDVHAQYGFMDLVRTLVAAGHTVVAVFHDLALAARYADRLLLLDRGRLVAAGPPRAVLTEEAIARVFRMQARLSTDDDGHLQIHYVAPRPA